MEKRGRKYVLRNFIGHRRDDVWQLLCYPRGVVDARREEPGDNDDEMDLQLPIRQAAAELLVRVAARSAQHYRIEDRIVIRPEALPRAA